VTGHIVRLQIQTERLKTGDKPHRWYDPTNIQRVTQLHVDENGSTGVLDGQRVLDVHHVAHPRSGNHGQASGLSVGFMAHYRAMRERFGPRVADGSAGENVLVDNDELITKERFDGAFFRTGLGDIAVDHAVVAEPCVEFSRFVLGVDPADRSESMREPLQQLRGGIRGFYVALAEPVTLSEGDVLVLDK
jgi:hypothetical protein